MPIETPDYNYYTSPEVLQAAIDRVGFVTILTFCQNNQVQVVREADYSYGAIINNDNGTWSTDMDGFSAMVFGVINYIEHHKDKPLPTNQTHS